MLPLQKEELKKLIRSGNRIEAVKYARETFNVSLQNAVRLVNSVDQELNPGKKINLNSFSQDGRITKIVSYVFGGLGALFLGISILLFYFDQRAINTYIKTSGIVVANRVDMDSDSEGYAYAPEVAFQWEGTEKIYQSSTYTNPPSIEVGASVNLYVNPNDPSDVIIDSFGQRFVAILVFGGLGAAFLGVLVLTNKFMR